MDRRMTRMHLGAVVLATSLGGMALLAGASGAATPDEWPAFKGDAARLGIGVDGPDGDPVVRWRYQADGAVNGNVSIANGLVYFSSDDAVLHALDVRTGVERWRRIPERPPVSGPTVIDGSVYVFEAGSTLVALDAMTGAVRWGSPVQLHEPTSPTVGAGAVIAGTADGQLVAIETADGSERWRTKLGDAPIHTPAYAEGGVFAGTEDSRFVRVEAADGSVSWELETAAFPTGTAVVADGVAYLGAANYDPTGDGRLWAVDAESGELRWRLDEPVHVPSVVDGVGYAGSLGLGVSAYDLADGSRGWTFPVTGFIRPIAVAEGVVYVPTDDDRAIHALNAVDGTELWRFDLESPTDCCVAVAQGAIYVGTPTGQVYAIGGSDEGSSEAPAAASATASPVALHNPYTVVDTLDPDTTGLDGAWAVDVGPDGDLYVVDSKPSITVLTPEGEQLTTFGSQGSAEGQLNLGELSPSIAVGADGLIHVTEGGNHRVSVFQSDGTFVRHIGGFGDTPGRFIAPLELFLDDEGHVYVIDDALRTVSKFDASGTFIWRIGGEDEVDPFLDAYFHRGGVDRDGRIWIASDGPSRLIAVDQATGRRLDVVPGRLGGEPGAFDIGPCGLELDAHDNAHVIDCSDRRLNVYDAEHRPIASWDAPETLPFGLSYAFGPDGRMYAVAGGNRAEGENVVLDSPDSIVVMDVDLPRPTD
jgi:outer membrane protein assembly factor BamB